MDAQFEYGFARVRDLRVTGEPHPRTGKFQIDKVSVAGLEARPTSRFWKSFFMRFGISERFFRYFRPDEVFQRISAQHADDSLRYCIEHGADESRRFLAVSKPTRPLIRHGEIADLVHRLDGTDVHYADGIVTSCHRPPDAEQTSAESESEVRV